MMHSGVNKLIGYSMQAVDRTIGAVDDLYFDDERWVIRYLICNTGDWLAGRRILISPISILELNADTAVVSVNLTADLVEKSPDISLKQPVSRRLEAEYSDHFDLPVYWHGGELWGGMVNPTMLVKSAVDEEEIRKSLDAKSDEAHLRSVAEVIGYHIKATDGYIGHIEDLYFEPDSWQISQVIVDTRNLLHGKKVTIAPSRIDDIHWSDSTIFVDMTKEAIKSSPLLD